MPGSQQNLWVGSQLQDLRVRYTECGGMLIEAQEEVKTLRQQALVTSSSVTHCAYTVPLVRMPWPPALHSGFLCLGPAGWFLPSVPLCPEVWVGALWGSPGSVPLLHCRKHFLASRRPWPKSSECP